MFGQVLDKLDTWLSRSFLLSNYFPWLAFSAMNVLMTYLVFPGAAPYIERYVRGEPAEKAVVIIVALGTVAVAAYITAPLVGFMTKVLEGNYIPPWISGWMAVKHARQLRSLDARRKKLVQERGGFTKEWVKNTKARLAQSRRAGVSHKVNRDPPLIDESVKAVGNLQQRRDRNQPIEFGEIIGVVQTVAAALERNCADALQLQLPVDPTLVPDSQKLHGTHTAMTELLDYARNISIQQSALASLERDSLFAAAELAPTRLGNDAAALRSYCETRYGLDFDFFWPRLQVVLQKNEKLSAALVNAKIQLDFGVLLLWLTAFFTASWLVILTLSARSLVLLILIATLGPLATRIWLAIVHASYAGFAELVRSAIDLSRFDLLRALHLPLPGSSSAERSAWEQTTRLLMLADEDVRVTFQHPAP